MTIASDLLQRHIETLVADNGQWQTLIADDLVWELPWGVATFASCRLCQGWFGRGHGWDGDDWAPQALPLLV